MAGIASKMGEVDTLRFYMARAVHEYHKKSLDGHLDWADILERSQCDVFMTENQASFYVSENFKKHRFDSVEGFLEKLKGCLLDQLGVLGRDYLYDSLLVWPGDVVAVDTDDNSDKNIHQDNGNAERNTEGNEGISNAPKWLDVYSIRLWISCDMLHAMEQNDIEMELMEDEKGWHDYVLAFNPRESLLRLKSLTLEEFGRIRTPEDMKVAVISCWAMDYEYHGGSMPDKDQFCAVWIFELLDRAYHEEGPKFDLRDVDVESGDKQTILAQVIEMGLEAGVLRARRTAREWARWFVDELFHNEGKWRYFNTLPGTYTTVQYEVLRSGRQNKWWGVSKLTELDDLVQMGCVSGMKRLGIGRNMFKR